MHFAILLTFISYYVSLRSLFCLFLSGRLRQVLLFKLSLHNNFLVCVFCSVLRWGSGPLDPDLIEHFDVILCADW